MRREEKPRSDARKPGSESAAETASRRARTDAFVVGIQLLDTPVSSRVLEARTVDLSEAALIANRLLRLGIRAAGGRVGLDLDTAALHLRHGGLVVLGAFVEGAGGAAA